MKSTVLIRNYQSSKELKVKQKKSKDTFPKVKISIKNKYIINTNAR